MTADGWLSMKRGVENVQARLPVAQFLVVRGPTGPDGSGAHCPAEKGDSAVFPPDNADSTAQRA